MSCSNTPYLFSKVLQTLHTASIKWEDSIEQLEGVGEVKHTQIHTHIPTEAHIFCKTRSYSIILQSGTRGGMRSPGIAIHRWHTEGTSETLLISDLTVVTANHLDRCLKLTRINSASELRENRWHTLLWSPICLCFHYSHSEGLRSSCLLFSAPKMRKKTWNSPIVLIFYHLDTSHKKQRFKKLTLTLMILLWKLFSTTMTSPASAGESVPSCLKSTLNISDRFLKPKMIMMLLKVSYDANLPIFSENAHAFLPLFDPLFMKCVGVKYAVLDIAILENRPLCALRCHKRHRYLTDPSPRLVGSNNREIYCILWDGRMYKRITASFEHKSFQLGC